MSAKAESLDGSISTGDGLRGCYFKKRTEFSLSHRVVLIGVGETIRSVPSNMVSTCHMCL